MKSPKRVSDRLRWACDAQAAGKGGTWIGSCGWQVSDTKAFFIGVRAPIKDHRLPLSKNSWRRCDGDGRGRPSESGLSITVGRGRIQGSESVVDSGQVLARHQRGVVFRDWVEVH